MASGKYFVAPSLNVLLLSVNQNFPRRDKSSDGALGDASHAARASEHNPCWACTGYQYGIIRARDFDIDDNDAGRDLRKEILAACIGHPAVWYVISNGIIYSRTVGWAARKYNGPNPHTKHVHVSINKNEASAKNLTLKLKALGHPAPGGGSLPKPPAKPTSRFDIHPSRIREAAAGNPVVTETNPAYDEVTALLQWFVALTKAGGKPILFEGGVEQWQRAVRQKQFKAAGTYLKACIVNFQKRYGLVADGIFGPASSAIAGGKTGRFDIIGK
jgi:peptidoglycan hydrolase-like protein with peptidoglycan-binding domain